MIIYDHGIESEEMKGLYDLEFRYAHDLSEAIVVVHALQMVMVGEMYVAKDRGKKALELMEAPERAICDELLVELRKREKQKKKAGLESEAATRISKEPLVMYMETTDVVVAVHKALRFFTETVPGDHRSMYEPNSLGQSDARIIEAALAEKMIGEIEAVGAGSIDFKAPDKQPVGFIRVLSESVDTIE